MPHHEIFAKARRAMALRSTARASEVSLEFLLKRRLPKNDPGDHTRYIEIEAARIVETLRHLRDEYRIYFEERGCNPIAEMYWVVVRCGVKDWAIMALRSAAVDYIAAAQVDQVKWKTLFDLSAPYNDMLPPALAARLVGRNDNSHTKLIKTIRSLLPQSAFDQVIDGGPFGREYQIYLAGSFPGRAFLERRETLLEVIERRQRTWDDARPWSEGLATLYEVTLQEVMDQFYALGEDAREAERQFVHLSVFQRIAYTHLVSFAHGDIVAEANAKDRWAKLLFALDEAGLEPGATLEGVARNTLMAARKKGQKVQTWQECYATNTRVTLDDAKPRSLRHEITHAIHNAAKTANYHMSKVWGHKAAAPERKSRI